MAPKKEKEDLNEVMKKRLENDAGLKAMASVLHTFKPSDMGGLASYIQGFHPQYEAVEKMLLEKFGIDCWTRIEKFTLPTPRDYDAIQAERLYAALGYVIGNAIGHPSMKGVKKLKANNLPEVKNRTDNLLFDLQGRNLI